MNSAAPVRRRTLAAALLAVAVTVDGAVLPSPQFLTLTGTRERRDPIAGCAESVRLGYQEAVAVQVLRGVFERSDTSVVDRFVRPDCVQCSPPDLDGADALKNFGARHQGAAEAMNRRTYAMA